jgi:hypothetical protein
MQVLVDERMVETPVDEVDAEIGKDEEEGELKPIVPGTWTVCEGIVEFGITADFSEEKGCSEERDPRHGVYRLADFLSDLVFEEFGVFEGCLVEDEDIGEGGDYEVDCGAGEPCDEV